MIQEKKKNKASLFLLNAAFKQLNKNMETYLQNIKKPKCIVVRQLPVRQSVQNAKLLSEGSPIISKTCDFLTKQIMDQFSKSPLGRKRELLIKQEGTFGKLNVCWFKHIYTCKHIHTQKNKTQNLFHAQPHLLQRMRPDVGKRKSYLVSRGSLEAVQAIVMRTRVRKRKRKKNSHTYAHKQVLNPPNVCETRCPYITLLDIRPSWALVQQGVRVYAARDASGLSLPFLIPSDENTARRQETGRKLMGNQVGQHVHLWLTGVTNYEQIDFLCLSYSEYRILLQSLEETNSNEYIKTLHSSVCLQMSLLFAAE